MSDRYIEYVSIVKCPRCGQDKWKYLGNDLDREPPCAICLKKEADGNV
jgi:hypothetical protein